VSTFAWLVVAGISGAVVGVLTGLIATRTANRTVGVPVGLLLGVVAAVLVGAFAQSRVSPSTPSVAEDPPSVATQDSSATTDTHDQASPSPSTPSNTPPPPPEVVLVTEPASVDAGAALTFSYSVTGETEGRPKLQRAAGSSTTFETLQDLMPGRNRSVDIAAPDLPGTFQYRIAVVGASGQQVVSDMRSVSVFAQLALKDLCRSASEATTCFDAPVSIRAGGRTFIAVVHNGCCGTEPPYWGGLIEFDKATSCTSLHLEFAADSDGTDQGESAAHVVQNQTDEQVATEPNGSVGVLDASLDGSPFLIEANSTNGRTVYANGYARCSTQNGLSGG